VESFKIVFKNNICGQEGVPCSRLLTIDIGSAKSLESVVLIKGVTPQSTKRFEKREVFLFYTNFVGSYRILVRDGERFIIVDIADLQLSVRWDKINEVTITLHQKWKGLVN
jgi:hypothetical protein